MMKNRDANHNHGRNTEMSKIDYYTQPYGTVLEEHELDALTADQLRQAIQTYGLVVIRRHHPAGIFDMLDPGTIAHCDLRICNELVWLDSDAVTLGGQPGTSKSST
jgi:hypothetical protein